MKLAGSIRDDVENFILWLAKAKQVCGIYGTEHKLYQDALVHLYQSVTQLLDNLPDMTLGIIGNEIAFDKEPFYKVSRMRREFIKHLKALRMQKLQFLEGLSQKELNEFVLILNYKPPSNGESLDFNSIFQEAGIEHILVASMQGEENDMHANISDIDAFTRNTFDESRHWLEKVFNEDQERPTIHLESLRQITANLVNSLLINKNLLLILTSLRLYKDEDFIHNINVCIFTMMQAELLGIEPKYLMDIASAALLHNIGEITPIAPEEKERIMKSLPLHAYRNIRGTKILLETKNITPLAPVAAFEQSIGYDMEGKPEKLFGKELNLISEMIAIAKYYDEARRRRSSREDNRPELIYDEMAREKGKMFHPDLLLNFFSALGVYPPGTLVELESREVALVIQPSLIDIKRPRVEILYNAYGEKEPEPPIISLLERNNQGVFRWTIKRSLNVTGQYELPGKYAN